MATATGESPAILGGTAIRPVERHGWEAFKFFFWDPKKRAVMGRTPKSWGLISLFYLCYYLGLVAFWAIMFAIFYSTLDDKSPTYMGDESLIKSSPGLGVRPKQPEDSVDSSMFIFNKDAHDDDKRRNILGYGTWAALIDTFLKTYEEDQANGGDLNEDCVKNKNAQSTGDRESNCKFPTGAASLGACAYAKQGTYGFDEGSPCVYLKLNKILGVSNKHYTSEEIEKSKDIPDELKTHLDGQPDSFNWEQVWVNCQGENPADREAIKKIEYFPKDRGFPGMYFPYLTESEKQVDLAKDYQSPLVAVQFVGLKVGQLVHVECRAFAHNIEYDRMHRKGMVRFEFLVLDDYHSCLYGDGFYEQDKVEFCTGEKERKEEEEAKKKNKKKSK